MVPSLWEMKSVVEEMEPSSLKGGTIKSLSDRKYFSDVSIFCQVPHSPESTMFVKRHVTIAFTAFTGIALQLHGSVMILTPQN